MEKSSIQLIEPGNWYCQRSGRDYLNEMIMYFRQLSQFLFLPHPRAGFGIAWWWCPANHPGCWRLASGGTSDLDQAVSTVSQGFHHGSNREFTRKNGGWEQHLMSKALVFGTCSPETCKRVANCYQMPSDFLQILSGLIPWTGQTDWGSTRIWFEHQ